MALNKRKKDSLKLFEFDEEQVRWNAATEFDYDSIQAIIESESAANGGAFTTSMVTKRRNELIEETVEAKREAFEAETYRYLGYSSVYELADRVLTNQDITVIMRAMPDTYPPAWSDGKTLVFNTTKINTDINEPSQFVLGLHGLNLHEVGHVLHTPRGGSEFVKWVVQNKYRQAFNYLEDNRIENLLVAQYPSVANFLIINLINNLINSPDNKDYPAGIYPLIAGRNFLPKDLYQHLLSAFVVEAGTEVAKTVFNLTTEYASLTLPKHSERAKEIVVEFAKLFNLRDPDNEHGEQDGQGEDTPQRECKPIGGTPPINSTGCSERAPMDTGRQQAASQQEKLQDISRPNYTGNDLDFEGSDDNTDTDDTDKAGTDTGSDSDSPTSDTQSDTESKSFYESMLDSLTNSTEVQQQVNQTVKAIRNAETKIQTLAPANFKTAAVTNAMREASRKFAEELSRAEIDGDPSWLREQPSGKLNIKRFVHEGLDNLDTLFDRWTFSDQDIEIEAAVLIDNSGSMSGRDVIEANRYAWVIKRAIEQINGHCATLTFSTTCKRLYDRDQRASATEYRYVPAQMDTQPYPALNQARLNLTSSHASIKTCFILTDGAWGNTAACNNLIAEMKQQGVIVVTLFLSSYAQSCIANGTSKLDDFREYGHGASVFSVIGEARDLSKVARDVLLQAVKSLEAR